MWSHERCASEFIELFIALSSSHVGSSPIRRIDVDLMEATTASQAIQGVGDVDERFELLPTSSDGTSAWADCIKSSWKSERSRVPMTIVSQVLSLLDSKPSIGDPRTSKSLDDAPAHGNLHSYLSVRDDVSM